jgi:hypothetical protein
MTYPYISFAIVFFGLIFLVFKNKFGLAFRVKKSAILLAVAVLAVLFWPYQY